MTTQAQFKIALDALTRYDKTKPIEPLAEVVKEHIMRACKFYDWNITHAARALGVTQKTIYKKLHAYGVYRQPRIRSPKNSEKAAKQSGD